MKMKSKFKSILIHSQCSGVEEGCKMVSNCVFVYECICVFVYLCVCVFVYLCICAVLLVGPVKVCEGVG